MTEDVAPSDKQQQTGENGDVANVLTFIFSTHLNLSPSKV
jgi:hypothetical protein